MDVGFDWMDVGFGLCGRLVLIAWIVGFLLLGRWMLVVWMLNFGCVNIGIWSLDVRLRLGR